MGGRKSCPDCEDFEWSDGTPWDYTSWHHAQPDDAVSFVVLDFVYVDCLSKVGTEDCIEINWQHQGSSGWNDVTCDRSNRGRFVCKKSSEKGELSQKCSKTVSMKKG